MKTINYEEVEFHQNPEKRKTVAVISGVELDAYIDYSLVTEDQMTMEHLINIPEEIMMPSTIKAMSTCHSSDDWDPEVGKKQAFFKLLRSYNKMKNRAFKRLIQREQNQIEIINKLVSKCDGHINHYDQLVRHPRSDEGESR